MEKGPSDTSRTHKTKELRNLLSYNPIVSSQCLLLHEFNPKLKSQKAQVINSTGLSLLHREEQRIGGQ